jgi:riboflavin kinase/FMN adenylyltransferase
VTIGAYDGVHLGHRAVIDRVRKLAADRGVAAALVTFDQHPARLVRPETAPLLLTDPEQKLELLEAHLLDFDGDLYDERAHVDFVERLRGEVKFDSVEALIEQIGRDCDDARRVLA